MNSGNGGGGAGGAGGLGMMGMRASPFTVSQWQELEHQALIFKYMVAGLPVPPDLVLPIQKSFESISHRFFHHPTMGYCSFYGKKVDPEPGRCRRTDGKKWRCSKDAYPDSKYCERHMHRGRNRSRKPVESQTITQSSSTVTSLTATGSSGGTGSYQNLPLHAFGNPQGTTSGTNQSHYHVDSISCGIPNKDYRYLQVQGLKPEVGEHSFFTEASGISSHPQSKSSNTSILQNDYPQHSFFNSEFTSGEPVKQEGQSLRPFFDEWPKTRDSWSGLEDERSHQTSFSTTKLSISIPMASSDLSATSSRSPHGEFQTYVHSWSIKYCTDPPLNLACTSAADN
ncbi:Growth-regulating factor 4 [Citrus sinensis]|uniref:Growth-regulating factor 4 n=1 Tax=Citrus sinensis TaxID=2711 RepID=A0ACB8LDA6_CITSI|nr:Growth-regulating factor 4 [Citrus sinensis]